VVFLRRGIATLSKIHRLRVRNRTLCQLFRLASKADFDARVSLRS
jgi:hypothetical protein